MPTAFEEAIDSKSCKIRFAFLDDTLIAKMGKKTEDQAALKTSS